MDAIAPSIFYELIEKYQIIILLLDRKVVTHNNFYKLADHVVHQARFEFRPVFPILLEPCEWDKSSLQFIPVYPISKHPISMWESSEAAWNQIADEIWDVLKPYTSFYPESERAKMLRSIGKVAVGTDQTFVSGFLISSDVLLTSNRLIDSREKAAQAMVSFTDAGGLTASFTLMPDRFFLTDMEMGVSLVSVNETPAQSDYGQARTISKYRSLKIAQETVKPGEQLDATNFERAQQLRPNTQTVHSADEDHIRYQGPTITGSAGGPLLNKHFEVVAVNLVGYELADYEMLKHEGQMRTEAELSVTVPTLSTLFQSVERIASKEQRISLREYLPRYNRTKHNPKVVGLPVVLFYFAQNPDQVHLPYLENEYKDIQLSWETNQLSSRPVPVQYILRDRRQSILRQLFEDIHFYSERIVLIQFSGGPDIFNDKESQIDDIAKLLGKFAVNLKVVVLNGCSTHSMIESLFHMGSRAVIGINSDITYEDANKFSVRFHETLLRKSSISQAFADSTYELLDYVSKSPLIIGRSDTLKRNQSMGLFIKDDGESMVNDIPWWGVLDEMKEFGSAPVSEPDSSVLSDWQPNGNTVLVTGTGKNKLTDIEGSVSEAIGLMLATERYGLVGGGWPGVDRLVGKAYTNKLTEIGVSEKDYFTQVVVGNQQPDYKGGSTVKVISDSEWYKEALSKASVVIMIGGLGGTYTTFKNARDQQIPIIPIVTTGGDASRAYHKQKKTFLEVYSQNQELCALYEKLDDSNLGGDQVAQIVKSMLKLLIFPLELL